jgi:hypothetical protein
MSNTLTIANLNSHFLTAAEYNWLTDPGALYVGGGSADNDDYLMPFAFIFKVQQTMSNNPNVLTITDVNESNFAVTYHPNGQDVASQVLDVKVAPPMDPDLNLNPPVDGETLLLVSTLPPPHAAHWAKTSYSFSLIVKYQKLESESASTTINDPAAQAKVRSAWMKPISLKR